VKRGVAVALVLAASVSLPSAAQEPRKVFRIGILSPAQQTSTKAFDAFRKGLRELGYVDGENISIEYRLAAWDYSRLPAMAGELVRLPVDVIALTADFWVSATVTQVTLFRGNSTDILVYRYFMKITSLASLVSQLHAQWDRETALQNQQPDLPQD
jgi:hypothetical protein